MNENLSFYSLYSKYKNLDFSTYFKKVNDDEIINSFNKRSLNPDNLLALLSVKAENYIETMAQKAKDLSLQHFGRAILLYTPLYLSNYCINECLYCGFNSKVKFKRKKLSLEEVEKEATFIAKTGLQHILILTGESEQITPLSYIKECIQLLKKYFTSISIEIFPLKTNEYKELVALGVDGLTIYQEVYDEKIYSQVHLKGPKKDYAHRLDTAQRAGDAKMRTINIGALLGLGDWRKEAFFMLLHAKYLQDLYPEIEISVSLPRLRPQVKNFKAISKVSDKNIVQIITAARIFLPRLGITLSTRENSSLRDNLLPLGITKISAGSTTAVGGHINSKEKDVQFEIADQRDVATIRRMLLAKGYQPVLKDWVGV